MRVKLLKRVENIVARGEIARFEQFLLFPQCCQKTSAADASKTSICGKGLTNDKKDVRMTRCKL